HLFRIAGNEIGEGVLTDDRLFGEADGTLELRFSRFGSSSWKAVEEFSRLFNGPADIDIRKDVIRVRGEHLLELVLEAVNALVEAIDLLNWERPFKIEARLSDRLGRRFRKSGHKNDFGLPHLEREEEQEKDEQEDDTYYER